MNMKRVLFISATARVDRPYLDPSARYRCYNPASILTQNGFIVDVVSFKNFDLKTLQRYNLFVFHRPSFEKKLLDAIEQIHKIGAQLFADYDDLIFSSLYALESSIYKTNRATKEECLRIFNNNQRAMMLFENFIVSTSPLKEKILELKPEANVSVIHNAISLDVVNRVRSQKEMHRKLRAHKKVISYLSGTKSHDMDFKIVEDVLKKLLEKYQDIIELQLVGPLEYNKEKLPSATHISYVDYEYLSKLIAKTDINIAPLETNNFTNCKSGLKFFESGILFVPSVVTPIDDMLRFKDSQGITYAQTPEEWYTAIERLIVDEEYYQQKAKYTYEYVLSECTMLNVYEQYKELFQAGR